MDDTLGGFSPTFVFAVYAIVWLVLFAYIFYVARRQGDIQTDIDALKREIEEKRQSSGSGN